MQLNRIAWVVLAAIIVTAAFASFLNHSDDKASASSPSDASLVDSSNIDQRADLADEGVALTDEMQQTIKEAIASGNPCSYEAELSDDADRVTEIVAELDNLGANTSSMIQPLVTLQTAAEKVRSAC